VAAQATLATLGFDPGGVDGQVGEATRKAVRAWQKSRGLAADGYLSAAVVARLKADTGPRGLTPMAAAAPMKAWARSDAGAGRRRGAAADAADVRRGVRGCGAVWRSPAE
jgi:peptidoglycan hydrolase-like protein with peptidoglycan-binding domain